MVKFPVNRRQFLATGLAATLAGTARAGERRRPHILLRSSWQTVNIGDIAHTPGVLRLLETHLPEADVTLWPSNVNNGVRELLAARFPRLQFATTADSRKKAFEDCDFLLHGSGPSLVAQRDVIRWSEATGKPYGVYGITLPIKPSTATKPKSNEAIQQTIDVLSKAAFVFFRDSVSLGVAKQRGCTCPIMEFGPDGAFATDLRDDAAAEKFLAANDLQAGKFLCCIPRLRYTPYWTIPSKNRKLDPVKHARNEEMKEHDHAQLRKAIVEITRKTDNRVLICPEDQTQMAVGKEMLYDKLPSDVRAKTAWRENYWLTGEAISTYVRSVGLFGNEMHSPIMCIGNGVPAVVCRFAEQTSKGFMWRDIGLDRWLFNLDHEDEVARIVPTVLDIAQNPDKAKTTAEKAQAFVEKRQRETMAILGKQLGIG